VAVAVQVLAVVVELAAIAATLLFRSRLVFHTQSLSVVVELAQPSPQPKAPQVRRQYLTPPVQLAVAVEAPTTLATVSMEDQAAAEAHHLTQQNSVAPATHPLSAHHKVTTVAKVSMGHQIIQVQAAAATVLLELTQRQPTPVWAVQDLNGPVVREPITQAAVAAVAISQVPQLAVQAAVVLEDQPQSDPTAPLTEVVEVAELDGEPKAKTLMAVMVAPASSSSDTPTPTRTLTPSVAA